MRATIKATTQDLANANLDEVLTDGQEVEIVHKFCGVDRFLIKTEAGGEYVIDTQYVEPIPMERNEWAENFYNDTPGVPWTGELTIELQFFDGEKWVHAGTFTREEVAWMSLGKDDLNYRTLDSKGVILTDKSNHLCDVALVCPECPNPPDSGFGCYCSKKCYDEGLSKELYGGA